MPTGSNEKKTEKSTELTSGQKSAVTRYKKELKEIHIKELETYTAEYDSRIRDLRQIIEELEDTKVAYKQNNEKLEEKLEEANTHIRTLSQFQEELEAESSSGETLVESLNGKKSSIENIKNQVDMIYSDIEDLHLKLFGDEDERNVGLNEKFQDKFEEISQLHEQNRKKQESLLDKIEGLLQGASAVALSKSFKEHKDSYNKPNTFYTWMFILAIIALMVGTLITLSQVEYDLSKAWKYTIANIPFIGGAVWLAIHANKQRSQNRRLQEEYAYKEDVSKVYYGLKKEIEELDDEDLGEELKDKILSTILEVVSLNPSNTLESSSHNDQGPLLDTFKNILERKKSQKASTNQSTD